MSHKFDPKKLEKLNNPERLKTQNPDLIWDTLNLDSPSVLIDIGAGTGFFARYFVDKMVSGKIYACDISEIMIDWINENLKEYSKKIIPVKMEESSVPLDNEIADLVYMMNLHHELENPLKILEESDRLLKNNGTLMIIDWKKKETKQGPPIEKRIEEQTVISQIEKAGFCNIKKHNILEDHYLLIAEKC